MGMLESLCFLSVVRLDPIADTEVSRFPFDTHPDAYGDAQVSSSRL
jgi:hypothetical protein